MFNFTPCQKKTTVLSPTCSATVICYEGN